MKRTGKNGPTYVVGIGASAGGLEALRALFGSLKATPRNMAFVVVQHLAPLHRSRLVELIASTTRLKVEEVRDGMRPRRGVIHITPPNANLVVERGRLRLKGTGPGPKPSVDTFFRSLAEDCGPSAVGIVLSGTGSDGALGIQAIRGSGGITLAQSAESAKYDSMPKAAIHTGTVDYTLAPQDIARELLRIGAHRPGRRPRKAAGGHVDSYEAIMRSLERRVGVDFFKYKQTTVRRRLERRLIATGCASLEEYATYLERTPGEAENLLQNILISVTSFFRDPEAFKALGQHVQEKVRARRDGQDYRCWVAGCASGEEAFSLAILLSETIERARTSVRLQIFATDLDEHALAFARRATYPAASLVGLPSRLIDKYFQPLDDGTYQVRSSLRDTIVFAKHNATEDPPFLNLDLISCRNVIIYFNGKLQEKLFKTFEYALARGGLLFLGKSEAIPQTSGAFRLIGRRQKIFERLATRGDVPQHSRKETIRENAFLNRAKELGQALDLFNAVVAGLAPDSIIIDSQLYIKHVFGAAGELLTHPPGQATQNVSKLLPPEMGGEMLALVHKAEKTGRAAAGRRHEFRLKSHPRAVQVTVVPLGTPGSRDFLACFHSFEVDAKRARRKRGNDGMPAEERVGQLETELAELREHLQTAMEEHATANEEMQSLNEEVQSANEELQSSNEELETTNEELQSSNEELTTVNEELTVKTAEMQSMNQRLQAIQTSIVYPLLIVDRTRRLLSFNPAARHLFRLTDAELGVDVRHAGTLGDVPALLRLVETALTRRKEPRLQLELGERSFEAQVQLFRSAKGAVEGAVASLVENTEIVRALGEASLHRERLSSILENTPAIVTMKDLGGVYVYANHRFAEMLRMRPESIVGHTDEELFGKDVGGALRGHDLDVVRRKKATEVTERYGTGGERVWSSSKFPLFDAKKRVQSVCSVSLDMTERIAYEQQLELLKRAFAASNQGMLILEPHNRDFRVAYASDEAAALAGRTPAKLAGLDLLAVLRELGLPAQAADGAPIAARIREETECRFVLAGESGSSGPRWLEVRSCRFDAARGGRVVLTFLDVTQHIRDQRTIEQQQDELARITRFSALGEIASGIAHEVNTPLGVIVAKADILKVMAGASAVEPAQAIGIAGDITRMAKNVSDIVHGLASVVSSKSNRLESACLRRIVADAVKMCEPRAQRVNAEIRFDAADRETPIECYPVQVLQVVINLLNNALDAISERRDRWVDVKLRAGAGEAKVTVTDSGPGISSGVAEKIFTPFFTTKKDREGTGIGLSLSRSIARRHHGELALDMQAAHTSFHLTLPRRQPERRVAVLGGGADSALAYLKDAASAGGTAGGSARGPERAA